MLTLCSRTPALGPAPDWSEVFGMPLYEAVRAAFALGVWVTIENGLFDPATMDLAHMQEVFETVAPREQIEKVVDALTTTVVAAKEMKTTVPALDRSLQRWEFNPLAARPLVNLGERGIWAPQVMLIERAMYPANLYYRGVDAWGTDFARILGARTEAYVGKHLGLVAGENDLHGEITYREGKNEVKSVDWIWVTPASDHPRRVQVRTTDTRCTSGRSNASDDRRAVSHQSQRATRSHRETHQRPNASLRSISQ